MKVLLTRPVYPYFVLPKCLYVLLDMLRKCTQDIIIITRKEEEEERKGLRWVVGGLFLRFIICGER